MGYSPQGRTELDTTERPSTEQHNSMEKRLEKRNCPWWEPLAYGIVDDFLFGGLSMTSFFLHFIKYKKKFSLNIQV